MTAALPNVRLELLNLPENVSLVREMLAGVAEAVPLADGQLDDVKTVVSEAANNVVLHAYDGARGPLEVEVFVADERFVVVVRDFGAGIRPRPATDDETITGIGLAVIQALTDRAEFRGNPEAGTEVRMEFAVPGARSPGPAAASEGDGATMPDEAAAMAAAGERQPLHGEPVGSGATAVLAIAPAALARRVLSRPVCALAARARFSIDRLADVQLVADALSAHADPALAGDVLRLGVTVGERELLLRCGPFRPGTARRLVDDSAIGGLAPVVELLTDEIAVLPDGDGELLSLRLIDPR